MSLPVGVFAFIEKCSGTAMIFRLRKFVADPALSSRIVAGGVSAVGLLVLCEICRATSDFLCADGDRLYLSGGVGEDSNLSFAGAVAF